MSGRIEQEAELSGEVSRLIQRDKTPINNRPIHKWFGRAVPTISMLAALQAMLENPSPAFLEDLLLDNPRAWRKAGAEMRDYLWLSDWARSEAGPKNPRVFDPFAGSGNVGAAADRLDADVCLSDASPVAFHILKATRQYPQALKADSGTWRGLVLELDFWLLWLKDAMSSSVDRSAPAPQLCSLIAICAGCQANVCRRPDLVSDPHPVPGLNFVNRLSDPCPICAQPVRFNQPIKSILWGWWGGHALHQANDEDRLKFEQGNASAWEHIQRGLEANVLLTSLNKPFPQLPAFKGLLRHGINTFAGCFPPTSLIFLANLQVAVFQAQVEMEARGYSELQTRAITTYLSFVVSNFADRTTIFCGVSPNGAQRGTWTTMALSVPKTYLQQSQIRLLNLACNSILTAVREECKTGYRAAEVNHTPASKLPFPDDSMDAGITSPPYFDSIDYTGISEWYWTLEKPILAPEILDPPWQDWLIDTSRHDHYLRGLTDCFAECSRVLKPGAFLSLIVQGSHAAQSKNRIEALIEAAQGVGLALFKSAKVATDLPFRGLAGATWHVYILTFRKPRSERVLLLAADTATTAQLISEDKPIQYQSLSELILEDFQEDELREYLPLGGRGSLLEQVMESLADAEPADLLQKLYGGPRLKRIARERSLDTSSCSAAEAILADFGFAMLPENLPIANPALTERVVRTEINSVNISCDKGAIRGFFMNSVSAIEDLIRMSVCSWAQLLFACNWQEVLTGLISTPEKPKELSKLSFGDWIGLFRGLPGHCAITEGVSDKIVKKLGIVHIYKLKSINQKLDDIVKHRNNVEHDKGRFWSGQTIQQLKPILLKTMENILQIITDGVNQRAFPRVATPLLEIRDRRNRLSYQFKLDNDSIIEIRASEQLNLQSHYIYFGSQTNPKPVDPLLLPFSEFEFRP